MKQMIQFKKLEQQSHSMKCMKYSFLIGILMLAIILPTVLVSAESDSSLGTFKQHECIKLMQTCSNCTYVYISSVQNPASTIVLGERIMTKDGTSYNYTLCNSSILGTYRVNGYGDLDGVNEVWSYLFYVTPAGGAENNTTFFIMLAVSSLVLLLLAFIFKNYIFAIISGFAFLGTGVYGMIFGFGNMTNLYTRIISYIIIGLGIILTIVSSFDYMKDMSGEGDDSGVDEDEF